MASQGGSHNTTGSTSSYDDVTTGSGCKVYGSIFKPDSRYEYLNPLGKGSYGIVCAARDRETGQRLAIKKISPMAKRSVDARHTLREMLLLQMLGNHPNVVSLHNLSTNLKDDELYIVMDLMDTDMHRVIQSSQTLSESHIKYFLHQLLRGVKYLHDNGVLHRDLKPGNLLLTKTCQLKIADFGLARKTPRHTSSSAVGPSPFTERPRSAPAASVSSTFRGHVDRTPMTEHVVTRWYRAPELMLQPDGLYDESIDMWSVGCIFAEILGRKALFPGKNFLHQLTLIFDIIGTPPQETTGKIKSSQAQRFLKSLGKKPRVPFRTVFPNATEEALDLLERLLEFDPDKRISAKEALAHPYMQPIEKKYKGIDPPPSSRVDFSFDTKKLTKLDLRALIIKEVDIFRRSVAHTAALDTDTGVEPQPPLTTTSANSKANYENGCKQRPTSAPATALSTSTKPGTMHGSAGISTIHSSIRQCIEFQEYRASDGDITGSTFQRPSAANPHYASAAIGSSRQRIRKSTKPPVPKQTAGNISDTQGSDQVTPALYDTTALHSSAQKRDRDAPLSSNVEPENGAQRNLADSSHEVCLTEQKMFAQLTRADQNRTSSIDSSKVVARTALTVLERKSRKFRTQATVDQPNAPTESTVARKTIVEPNRPEITRPSISPKSPASSSSSSGISSEDTNQQTGISKGGYNTQPRASGAGIKSVHPGLPQRRNAPASLSRRKPTPNSTNANSVITKIVHRQTAYVGSTTSLIRAQRLNNGQSLAETADQVVAAIVGKSDMNHHDDSSRGLEDREESSDIGLAQLKSQRSTAQLNQIEAAPRKPTRKLTVPKSPKFSVMSWQKKKELGAGRVITGADERNTFPKR